MLMRVVRLPGIHHDANCTLIIGNASTLMIDVGTSWYQLLIYERVIGQLGEENPPSGILLTSRRFNHCGGAAFVSEQFSGIPIHIESSAASALSMGDFASTGARRFDSEMPKTSTEAVVDSQIWDLGDCQVEAIALPGHCQDGMGYWLPERRIAAVGSVIPMLDKPSRWDMMGGCLPDLADSVELLLELELEMLIPGFGEAISGKAEIRKVLKQHLTFFEQCIEAGGDVPAHWQRPAQTANYLTPRTSWKQIREEE
jgi:glyoxylase-like metal-dependent hydrolase (beta-lactamase superfamily II)